LLTDWDEIGNLDRGAFIDVSTMLLFIWPSSFSGKYFLKSTNQKQELPMVGKSVNGIRKKLAIFIEDLP